MMITTVTKIPKFTLNIFTIEEDKKRIKAIFNKKVQIHGKLYGQNLLKFIRPLHNHKVDLEDGNYQTEYSKKEFYNYLFCPWKKPRKKENDFENPDIEQERPPKVDEVNFYESEDPHLEMLAAMKKEISYYNSERDDPNMLARFNRVEQRIDALYQYITQHWMVGCDCRQRCIPLQYNFIEEMYQSPSESSSEEENKSDIEDAIEELMVKSEPDKQSSKLEDNDSISDKSSMGIQKVDTIPEKEDSKLEESKSELSQSERMVETPKAAHPLEEP